MSKYNNDQEKNDLEKINFAQLPIGKEEDVEFSYELADEADRVAMERAQRADHQNEQQ